MYRTVSVFLFLFLFFTITVICGTIVTGTTFDAHVQILEQVKFINNQNLDLVCLNLEESPSNQDYRVIIVFCPISSRVGTDIEAAMRKVTGKRKRFFCSCTVCQRTHVFTIRLFIIFILIMII